MRTFKFSKLVRDKIVGSIISNGGNPRWKTLSKKDYIEELKKKMIEESSELISVTKEELVEEIADLQEIIDNLIKTLDVSKQDLAKIQKEKNKKKGSFKKRHYVDKVEVENNAKEIEYYLKSPEKYPEVK